MIVPVRGAPLIVAILIGACGRVGFAIEADAGPAAGDGGNGADVGGDADGVLRPYVDPMKIMELSTSAREIAVVISDDELEVFYSSNQGGPMNIYTATRATLQDPFTGIDLARFDGGTVEGELGLSRDGLTAVVATSGRVATRATPTSPWSALVDEPMFLDFDGFDFGGGDLRMVMHRDDELYESVRADRASPWSVPVLIQGLDDGLPHTYPSLSQDGLHIFYEAGQGGSFIIQHARRPSLDAPFETPVPALDPLPVERHGDPRINSDGTRLYFTGGSPDDVYVATRAP